MKKVALIVILLSVSNMVCSQSDCTNYDSIGDYTTAFSCYMSDTLNPHKQYKIGEYYYEGKVVDKDYNKAVEWFTKSANANDSDGQNNLGYCYRRGKGVPQDDKMAVYYFTLAANNNNSFAQYNLGWCYENAKGVEQDLAKAAYWFEKAAEQGDVTAQLYIGNYYFTTILCLILQSTNRRSVKKEM